ncbi:MAG: protein translocase subunit secA, partial [Marmoricola sp.]|nr:protein translocase subunit secA [Marmoricola sp.]
ENKSVTKSIASAQAQVEAQNFESRKNVLKYDDVMSRQREVIYAERRLVLEGADLHDQVVEMIDDVVTSYVVASTEGFPEQWDLEALWAALKTVYPVSLRASELEREAGGRDGLDRDTLLDDLKADAQKAYQAREAEVGSEVMRELERQVMLSVLDRKWREHLYEMDYLREGIGLRAYSQRDPLVEYQREGFDMFNAMKEGIREETVGFLFNLEVEVDEEPVEADGADVPAGDTLLADDHAGHDHAGHDHADHAGHEHVHIRAKGLGEPRTPSQLTYTAPSEDGEAEVVAAPATGQVDAYAGISRNAECPCGSGKKYKKCHGAPGGPTGLTARANG